MAFISNDLKYIEVPLSELLEFKNELGKIHLATDIIEKGKVYSVKGSDLSNPTIQKKFLDKGVQNVNIEITPKIIEKIIEKHPERYSDKSLDPNVQIVPRDEIRSHVFIREDVYNENDKLIVKKWTLLKTEHINKIRDAGVKEEYEIYEPADYIEKSVEAAEEKYKPYIMIIDDQMYVTDSLKMALEDNDLKVEAINDPNEAISKIRPNPPDIILLDINMPEMNGFEILEQLKLFGTLKDLPVIMLTARNTRNDIMKAIGLGAVDYIIKPFNYKHILRKIVKYLPEAKRNFCAAIIEKDKLNGSDFEIAEITEKEEEIKNKVEDLLNKI